MTKSFVFQFDCCGVNTDGYPADIQDCGLSFAKDCSSTRDVNATTFQLVHAPVVHVCVCVQLDICVCMCVCN